MFLRRRSRRSARASLNEGGALISKPAGGARRLAVLPLPNFCRACDHWLGRLLAATLTRLADLVQDVTPLDPRPRAKALEIVRGVPASATDERARLLYRWVLEHVQESKESRESDGRRVVTGGSGSRQAAFRYMLRLLGIENEPRSS